LGFAEANGLIWYFDRRRGDVACENPLNVAVEKKFYTSESPESENPAIMESFLAENVEGPFWPVLDSLEKKEVPSGTDIQHIAIFAAFLLTRVAAFRDALTKVLGDVMLASQNLSSTINSIDGLLKISKGGISILSMPKNNALYQMGHLGIEASKILITLNAHIMFSTADEPFITSDNPFVLDRMVDDNQPPSVSATSFMKWIPLSAKVAVGFGFQGNHIFFSNMNSTQVRHANIRLATAARQIVIAQSREQLEQILAVIPKQVPNKATSFPSVVS
jgi:hypothetical protein